MAGHRECAVLFLVPHVQALQGLRPDQKDPWVREAHAHHQVQKVLAFQILPVDHTFSHQVKIPLDNCHLFSASDGQNHVAQIVPFRTVCITFSGFDPPHVRYPQVEQWATFKAPGEHAGSRCFAQGHHNIWIWQVIKPVIFWSQADCHTTK